MGCMWLLLAVEIGYKECEKGMNLKYAKEKMIKLLTGNYESETGATIGQQAKVKIPRCPYDGLCDVSTKIDGVIYCDRASGVCNG